MFIFNPNAQNVQNNGLNISINSDVKSVCGCDEAVMLTEENKKLKNENELLKCLNKTYEVKIKKLEKIVLEDEIKIKKMEDKLNFFVDAYYNVAKERNEKIDLLKEIKNEYNKNIILKEKEILSLTNLLNEKEAQINKLKKQNENFNI